MAKTKASSRRKPNALIRFVRETNAELSKVNWPTRQEATQLTVIVLVVLFVMSAVLGMLDFLFSRLFAFIISLA